MSVNKYFAGMDIGGTHVRIALINHQGELIKPIYRFEFLKCNSVLDEVRNNISLPLNRFLDRNKIDHRQLYGLGISLAALFYRDSGNIAKWPNNPLWDAFPLRSYLQKEFQIPIILEDDANSAAIGEHLMGAGKGYNNFAYVTISTGIGCGLILNNNLYTGSKGWAGEIGHIRVDKDGPLCTCGAKGCLQALVSGPSLYDRYIRNSNCGENTANHGVNSLECVSELAKMGEKSAVRLFEYAGKHIASMLSNIVMLLDLPLIILGGGVSQTGEVLLNKISSELESGLKQFKRHVEVTTALLHDNSGVIGASSLILKEYDSGK